MKNHILKNLANPLTLLLMALAMALSFLACEEKGKKAEAGGGDANVEQAQEAFQGDAEEFQGDSDEEAAPNEPINMPETDDGQLRKAVRAAVESFPFNPFPFLANVGYFGMSDFDGSIGDTQGGEALKSIFKQAYNQREKDLSGWLQPFIKRAAALILRENYTYNGWSKMVRQLLIAYADLAARPDGFREVYEIMNNEQCWDECHYGWNPASSAYSSILPLVRDTMPFILKHGESRYGCSPGYTCHTTMVWAYSFWGRRWHENSGNIEPIAATLQMLRDEMFVRSEADEPKCSDPLRITKAMLSSDGAGEFTDSRDNKTYRTIKGDNAEKRVMAENLNYKTDGSWCYDNKESNCLIYGRLYNWEAAKTACPSGWSLPSRAMWGETGDFARIFKSKIGWSPRYRCESGNGIDSLGFSALPGGMMRDEGVFYDIGDEGYWWSSNEKSDTHAYHQNMRYGDDRIYENSYPKSYGYSVRCFED